ncbi:MAG: hypothetical protein U0264_15575 [Candidatus Kapaibacterium sp.]
MKLKIVAILIGLFFTCAVTTRAQGIPRIFSYQGILTDKVGDPVLDGSYTITVDFYDSSIGGVPLYEEVLQVSTVGGTFNAIIGQSKPITISFDKQYYIGITLQGQAEFTPRTALVAVPYSLMAQQAVIAGGLQPGATGAVTSLNGGAGDLQISGAGATTITRTGNTLTVSSTDDGIKTLNPEDNSILVTNPNGPLTTLKVGNISITSLSSGSAVSGDILKFNGTNWGTAKETSYTEGNGISIKNQIIALASQNAATGQVLKWNGTAWVPANDDNTTYTAGNGIQITSNQISVLPMSGDVTGDIATTSVTGLLGKKIAPTTLANGQGLVYNSTANTWQPMTIDTDASDDIVAGSKAGGDLTGSYPNPTIGDGMVTTAKLGAGAITTDKIADAQVTANKLSPYGGTSGQALMFNGSNVVWGSPTPSGAAGGDLTGTYPNPSVGASAITTSKIADGNITTAKLADGSVTSLKITDGAVTTSKISTLGAVNGQSLTYDGVNVLWSNPAPGGNAGGDLTGTYPNPSIASNAVTTLKISDGAITTSKLNTAGAVSGQAMVFNGSSVVWSNPSPSGAAGGDLSGTYPNPTVATNAITTAKILDAAITSPKLGDGAVTTSKITDGAITTSKVNSAGATSGQALTFDGTNVMWGSPSPSGAAGGDLSGVYPNPTVAANAITTAKILDANITTPKLADGAVTASKITDGAITTAKVNSAGATSGQALTFDGTNVTWGSPSPSGAAGGDLSGVYPNPTVAANAITTSKILDGAITTSKILDGAITTSKILDGAITTSKILDGAVTTLKINDGAVTTAKMNSTGAAAGQTLMYDGANIVWGSPIPSGAAGGDLTGTYPNPTVASNAITTSKILDANITTPKLADGAVTTGKITDGAITTAKVNSTGATSGQALTFDGTNVKWGSPSPSGAASGDLSGVYPNPTVASNAITTPKILDGAITTPKLSDGAVTTLKITDGAITTAKVNSAGATSGQALTFDGANVRWGSPSPSGAAGGDLSGVYPNPTVASNAITSSKILDAAITTQKLSDGVVTTAKIADGAITTAKVNSAGATSGQALTYDGTNVTWGSPSPSGAAGGDLSGVYPNPTVAANAITTAKILDAAITTPKIVDGAVTTMKVNDGAITTSKINDGAITLSKVNGSGASSGEALMYNGTSVVWGSPSPSGAAGGDLTGTYPNPTVASNAITTPKILDGAITTPKLTDEAVTTSKITDGAITTSKVNSAGATSGQALTFDGTNVTWGSPSPSGAAGGDLSGVYPNPTVASNAITSAKILDANITTPKLADGAVTTGKITDGAVTTAKMNTTGAASGQTLMYDGTKVVWGSPIPSGAAGGDLTGTYPNPTIASNSIITTKILDAAITTPKIVDGAVTTMKVNDGAITTSKIIDGAITLSKVNGSGASSGEALMFNGTSVVWGSPSPSGAAGGDLLGSYPNPSIAQNAITTAKILDGNVTTTKLADGAVTTGKITDGAITNSKVNSAGATSGQALMFNGSAVIWGSPTPSGAAAGDLTGSYPAPLIASNAITTLKLADSAVTTLKIKDGAITTSKINSTGASSGQSMIFNGTSVEWGSPSPSGTAGGDLSGTYPNPSIATNAITTSKIGNGAITTSKINTSGAGTGQAMMYDGTSVIWGSPTPSGTAGGDLSGTYPNPDIRSNAVTTSKIANNAITSGKIADGAVTTSKVDATSATTGQALIFNGTSVAWGAPTPSGTAGGDLTGSYPNPTIKTDAITTQKLLDLNVTTQKIADDAVTSSKINNGAITTSKVSTIGAGVGQALTFNGTSVVWGSPAVSGTAGGDLTGTYPNPTIATNAVTTGTLRDGNVTSQKLSEAAVTTSKIEDGAVTPEKVNISGATTGQSLVYNGSILAWGNPSPSGAAGGDLSGTYPNPTIGTGVVSTDKLANLSVTPSKINTSGASAGQSLVYDGVGVVWGAVSPSGTAGGSLTGTYPNPTLANNAVTSTKISNGAVTLPKLSVTGASAGQGIVYNGTALVWGSPTPSGSAGGDLTGNYPNPSIAANVINSTHLVASSVLTDKIADAAVTTQKIADGAVSAVKMNSTGAAVGQGLIFDGTNVTWGNPLPSGTASGDLTGTYPAPGIAAGAVTTSKLAEGAVTTQKVTNGAITTEKVSDAAITPVKINSTGASAGMGLLYNGSSIIWGAPSPGGTAGGDLSGTYPNPSIATNAVTSDKLGSASVVNSKIADGAITTSKVVDGAITKEKINPTGATSGQSLLYNGTSVIWGSPTASGDAGGDLTGFYPNPTITTGAVTSTKLADNAVLTTKIADGAVTTDKLSDAGVTTAKMNDLAVTTSKIDNGAVTPGKLSTTGAISGQGLIFNGTTIAWGNPSPSGAAGGDLTGTYPNPSVATNAITTSKIMDGAVTSLKLDNGAVSSAKLVDGAVTSGKLGDASVISAKLADGAVTTAKVNTTGASAGQSLTFNGTTVIWGSPSPSGTAGGDLTGVYPNPSIASNTITSAKLQTSSVITSKLADGAVISTKIADASVTTQKIADGAVTTFKVTDGAITTAKVNSTGATSGQALTFDGANVVWGSPAPSGTAGGDLVGNYPNPTVGVGAITSTKILDGTITNSDIAPAAGIVYSKLNLTNGIANADVNATAGIVYSKLNLTNSIIAADITDNAITTSKIANNSVDGTKISLGSDATGDMLFYNSTGDYQRLPAGGNGQVLTVVGGVPTWTAAAGGTITGSGVASRVAFWDGTTSLSSNSNLYWDNTNSRLGIGTSTPNNSISTTGSIELTNSTSQKIIGSGDNLTLEQTSDVYGTTRLKILNRDELNGILIEQAGTAGDVVDLAFKATLQRNIRLENRFGFIAPPEFQIGIATNPTLVISDNASAFRKGTLSVGKAVVSSGLRIDALGNIGLTNNGTASELRLFEPSGDGINYTAFKAGTQSANLTYTLPASAPTAGQLLSSDATGVMSWISVSGGDVVGPAAATDNAIARYDAATGKLIQNSALIIDDYTASTQPNVSLRTDDGVAANIALVLSPKGNGALLADKPDGAATGGNARGNFAVDLQMDRNAATQVASGPWSVIGGGDMNTSSGINSTVSGGSSNLVSGDLSTISGGDGNSVSSGFSTIAGGDGLSFTAGAARSFGFNGNASDGSGSRDMSISTPNTAVFGDVDIWLAGNDNATRAIRFYDQYNTAGAFPNTANYVGLKAPNNVTADLTYTLPASAPAADGYVLSSTTAGVMSWEPPTSGSTVSTNSTMLGDGSGGNLLRINLGNSNTWTANQTFGGTFLFTSNSRIAMTNSDNNARDIRFQEPSGTGTQYVGFRSPSLSSNGNYSWPAAVGTVGQVMQISYSNGADSAYLTWGSYIASGQAAGGDLTGNYPDPTIASNAVTTAKIADANVTTIKIADANVTTAKLADASITPAKVNAAGATTGQSLTYNGTTVVWGSPSLSGSAGGDLTGSYPNPTIADNAITSAKIANGTITNADINASAAIAYSKLNLSNSIVGSDIASGTFSTSDVHFALGNTGTASELRLLEPSGSGANYTAFKAQAQSGNVTYTLPATAPTSDGWVLTSTATGTMSWEGTHVLGPSSGGATVGRLAVFDNSSGTLLKNSQIAFDVSLTSTPYPNVRLIAEADVATDIYLVLSPKGSGALVANQPNSGVTGGNARGMYAVDWQMSRSAANQVAGGNYATISGGQKNRASGVSATVTGGSTNSATGDYSFIGGGVGNSVTGDTSFIGGGYSNSITKANATISGGYNNSITNDQATIGGGLGNDVQAISATISGGNNNTIEVNGQRSSITGGGGNTITGSYSTIAGGRQLTLNGDNSFGFHANVADGTKSMTIAASKTAVFGNVDIWLASNDNTPRAIRFYDQYNTAGTFPSTSNYVGLKAPNNVTADKEYTLPADAPVSGWKGVMESTNAGVMSWRQTVITSATVNFVLTTTGNFSDKTVTVSGATSGDIVTLGLPDGIMQLGNVQIVAWVSANDTVTLRFYNNSGGDLNPAAFDFNIQITKP